MVHMRLCADASPGPELGPGRYGVEDPRLLTSFAGHARAPSAMFGAGFQTSRADAVGPFGERPEAAVDLGAWRGLRACVLASCMCCRRLVLGFVGVVCCAVLCFVWNCGGSCGLCVECIMVLTCAPLPFSLPCWIAWCRRADRALDGVDGDVLDLPSHLPRPGDRSAVVYTFPQAGKDDDPDALPEPGDGDVLLLDAERADDFRRRSVRGHRFMSFVRQVGRDDLDRRERKSSEGDVLKLSPNRAAVEPRQPSARFADLEGVGVRSQHRALVLHFLACGVATTALLFCF